MPFDGVTYDAVPLVRPRSYHPGVGATGTALAGALSGAYLFARGHGQIIGVQSMPHFLGSGYAYTSASGAVRPAIISTTAVNVARFTRWIPSHATHILAEIRFKSFAEVEPIVNHKIEITAGGVTVTGDTVTEAAAVGGLGRRNVDRHGLSARHSEIMEGFNEGDPGVGVARCFVEVSPALAAVLPGSGAVTNRSTVTVSGHATTDGDATYSLAGVVYRVDLVTAWWISVG